MKPRSIRFSEARDSTEGRFLLACRQRPPRPITQNSIRGWLCLIAPFAALPTLLAQTLFVPMGYLDNFGPTSEANAVTRDGTKIVGYSTSSLTENQACWWTTNGIVRLPGAQNWYANSAYAISADGNVIVGDRSFGGTEEAWYWTPATELQLILFPTAQPASTAFGVSGDGNVVVGIATAPNMQKRAFRWDRRQAQAAFLPAYPPSTVPNAGATGVSDDGRRVVGWVQISLNAQAAARWDDGGNPVLVSRAGDAVLAVTANSISPDGSVVVGSGVIAATGKGVGFRWTAASGVVALPNPTTGFYAIDGATAVRVSGDGRVIVGYGANVAGSDEAIFWVDGQPQRVSDVAFAAGVLPPSWEPFRAYGVDYFGNTICGYGRATSGKLEAYVLILDATPTPPPLVAPRIRASYATANGTLSIRYPTVPGLRYRVHGSREIQSLAPLTGWNAGLGMEQEFSANPAVIGGANHFFLRLEVDRN